ncbi:MAG: hypothetical protein IJY20_04305 [Clostridia bacterium]|nr:hypothetical protein [Clostridia bacterium]
MNRYLLRRALAGMLPSLWPAFWLVFILLTEPPAYALFMLAATALHETGHLFAFIACGEPLPRFAGRQFGLLLTPTGDTLSPGHELMICAAGPLFNLVACLALIPALRAGVASDASFCFFALNLFTALFNLLPLSGFDGGRMLSAALTLTCPLRIARAVCTAIALAGAIFFYFFALFLTFAAGAGPYPFLLAMFLLWSEGRHL